MLARMEVIRGAKTREIQLRLPTVIGRGGNSKLKLPASTVSRHHCEIYEYDGQVVVRDLGSSNGTLVNGHKIKGPTLLTSEDEVTIGPVVARLHPVDIVESPAMPVMPNVNVPDLDVSNSDSAAPSTYFVAPAEEAAPSLDELPAELSQPSGATASSGTAATHASDSGHDLDASDLQYAEPNRDGRSFIGIVAPDGRLDVPAFDANNPDSDVAADDSALNQFFDNLDDQA